MPKHASQQITQHKEMKTKNTGKDRNSYAQNVGDDDDPCDEAMEGQDQEISILVPQMWKH